ncbi:unnamed protein product [Sympodiomycopsis kandeliae]
MADPIAPNNGQPPMNSFDWSDDVEETLFAADATTISSSFGHTLDLSRLPALADDDEADLQSQLAHLGLAREDRSTGEIINDILERGQVTVDDLAQSFDEDHPFAVDTQTASTHAPAVYVRSYKMETKEQVRSIVMAYQYILNMHKTDLNERRMQAKLDWHSQAETLWLEYRGSTELNPQHRQ